MKLIDYQMTSSRKDDIGPVLTVGIKGLLVFSKEAASMIDLSANDEIVFSRDADNPKALFIRKDKANIGRKLILREQKGLKAGNLAVNSVEVSSDIIKYSTSNKTESITSVRVPIARDPHVINGHKCFQIITTSPLKIRNTYQKNK